jgi:hypothetical protein
MQMQLRSKKFIIGALVIALLLQDASLSFAYFSPVVSQVTAKAESDIRSSRDLNGTGSFTNIVQKFLPCENPQSSGCTTGVSGDFTTYFKKVAEFISASLLLDSIDTALRTFDSFSLAFGLLVGGRASSCMRDDLWAMEDLQNAVTQELFKAAALGDRSHTQLLWDDYVGLRNLMAQIKIDYRKGKKIPNTHYFPDGKDYYIDCPYNEFSMAFQDVLRRWEQNIYYTDDLNGDGKRESHWFSSLGQSWDWGNMAEMAQRESKRKAAEYIAKNTIRFGAGGTQGGNETSLLEPDNLQALDTGFDIGIKKSSARIWERIANEGGKWSTIKDHFTNKGLNMLQELKDFWPLAPIFTDKEYFGKDIKLAECVIYRSGKYWNDCDATELAAFKEGRCPKCESPTEKNLYELIELKTRQKKDWENTQDLIEKNYEVSFNTSAAEVYIFEMYDTLASVNAELEATYSKKTKNAALPIFYNTLYKLVKNQCTN